MIFKNKIKVESDHKEVIKKLSFEFRIWSGYITELTV